MASVSPCLFVEFACGAPTVLGRKIQQRLKASFTNYLIRETVIVLAALVFLLCKLGHIFILYLGPSLF